MGSEHITTWRRTQNRSSLDSRWTIYTQGLHFPMQYPIITHHNRGSPSTSLNREFHNLSTIPAILRPISLLSTPSPLTVTPTIFPTSLTPTHSGAISANNRTHRTASSLPIGFRSDIWRCCTSVGIVKETCAIFDLKTSVTASSLACFFEETARLSKTGTISGKRCSADFRARTSVEGGRGRVDWWSCLALMRENRSVDRAVVCLVFCWGVEVAFAEVALRGFCWALMAPALRSSSRRWPLERRGASLEREAQGVIG